MQVAKIGSRGRTTIPKTVRDEADLREGDTIAFEIKGDRLVVHKAASRRRDHMRMNFRNRTLGVLFSNLFLGRLAWTLDLMPDGLRNT